MHVWKGGGKERTRGWGREGGCRHRLGRCRWESRRREETRATAAADLTAAPRRLAASSAPRPLAASLSASASCFCFLAFLILLLAFASCFLASASCFPISDSISVSTFLLLIRNKIKEHFQKGL
ncbi:uncharacterized protein DS421_20g686360 [Arachis hypogaea]|nr:uncharacterized protein DS421_20g686360 [Arachis hypogaea]